MAQNKPTLIDDNYNLIDNDLLDNTIDTSFLNDDDDFDQMLNDFITKELETIDTGIIEGKERKRTKKPHPANIKNEDVVSNFFKEEKALYDAYRSFAISIATMCEKDNIPEPMFIITPPDLYSRFSPKLSDAFQKDIASGWDIMLRTNPVRLQSLPKRPSDEELLSFAEKTTDDTLQIALISYIEILIEIESCEIAYNLRKVKYRKRKIEKKIYMEHHKKKELTARYIAELKKKKFPVDAERLINNYFKTAKKDPEAAFKILVQNPATYAPIEIHKIPSKLFGLIKSKPEDGIKINKEIGKFLEKLKA